MTMDVFFSLAAACSNLISRNQMTIAYPHYGWQYIDYFGISSNKWFGGVKLRLERFSEKP